MCTSIALEKTLNPQKCIECKSCKDDIILLLLFNTFCRPEHFSACSQLSTSRFSRIKLKTCGRSCGHWNIIQLQLLSPSSTFNMYNSQFSSIISPSCVCWYLLTCAEGRVSSEVWKCQIQHWHSNPDPDTTLEKFLTVFKTQIPHLYMRITKPICEMGQLRNAHQLLRP